MTDLRKAAEMALDALRLYVTMYPQMDKGYMVDARETLRQALAQSEQEPVTHAVIAGVLIDFMGWLTSRPKRLVLSASDNASPAVKVIEEFAKMRGLSLDDAKVKDWQDITAQTEQVLVCDKDPFYCWSISCQAGKVCNHAASPRKEWVGLTDDEVAQIEKTVLTRKQAIKMIEHHLKEKNT